MKHLFVAITIIGLSLPALAQSPYEQKPTGYGAAAANTRTANQAEARQRTQDADAARLETRVFKLEQQVEGQQALISRLQESIGVLGQRLSSVEAIIETDSRARSDKSKDVPVETTIVGNESVTKYKSGKVIYSKKN